MSGDIVGFDTAQTLLAAGLEPVGIEQVPLGKAGRRVLARDVHAAIDAPRCDVAAMDGFAARKADLELGLRSFDVAGVSYPGAPFTLATGPGSAVRIMTGAAMPDAFDRVLPTECVAEKTGAIILSGEAPVRSHVRARSSDIRSGKVLLKAGQTIDARTIWWPQPAILLPFPSTYVRASPS